MNTNGSSAWDVFFKIASVVVIPLAAFILLSIMNIRVELARYGQQLDNMNEIVIQRTVDSDRRLDALESLHPRGSGTGGNP